MNTQILFVHQCVRHGVGQSADAQLNGIAVPNQRRHILRNSLLHLGNGIFRR